MKPCHSHKLAIAPMLDWTDRHYRYLARLLTKRARLYTEMVHMGAVVYGNRAEFLKYHPIEHPIALQLGGCDPVQLAAATRIVHQHHFDEVNLNCGCPSAKVQKGTFGAVLMHNVALVADCLNAMQDAADIEVTLKHRIGIDEEESYDFLRDFVGQVVLLTGCRTFIVHARNAWLLGLSPKENREIPPLKYDYVYRLKQDFPGLNIVINGGIDTLESIGAQFNHVDGVMVGRKAYRDPMFLAQWDETFFGGGAAVLTMDELICQLYQYARQELLENPNLRLRNIVKHYLGLFKGQSRASLWRQMLSNAELLEPNRAELILEAYEAMNAL